MAHSTTTPIQDIINRRVEIGLADLLLTIYDYAYSRGAGAPVKLPSHPGTLDLIMLVEARHQAEVLALRAWGDPPIAHDDLLGYLQGLPQQADAQPPIWLQALQERDALETERPHDWIRAVGEEGKP